MDDSAPCAAPPAGPLRGIRRGGALVFRAVPYAQARRFQAPEAYPDWQDLRDASSSGPQCPQAPDPLAFFIGTHGETLESSEDCQVLTIATPSLQGCKPVMVWLHGGAYLHGSGEWACHSPERLAVEGDVVVVCVSYRLGAFGFLAADGGATNCGTLDQRAALQWVQRNISAMGGDPARVTLFGQSAGGHAVRTLMALYGHEALFHRAIIQSAPLNVHQTAQDQASVAARFRRALQQDPYRASAANIVAAQSAIRPGAAQPLPFSPAFASRPTTPLAPIALMLGWTRNDAAPLLAAARRHGIALPPAVPGLGYGGLDWFLTRVLFGVPAVALAQSRIGVQADTYLYRLDVSFAGNRWGAGHCIDLPLLLGNASDWQDAPLIGRASWAEVDAKGRKLRAAWAAFAHSGKPCHPDGYDWKPFTRARQGFIRLR